MPWIKLDDSFAENHKIADLTDRAFRLHVAALCYSGRNLTDGTVDHRALRILAAVLGWTNAKRQAAELAHAGVWVADGDGYRINDYTDYNPSADEVREQRRRNAERQRRHRQTRNTVSNALRNGVTNGVSNAAPTRPVPSPEVQALLESPPRDEGGHETLEKLVTACGGDQETRQMIQRTVNRWHSNEADLAWALESCRGPGVRDKRRVALTELKRRGEEHAA